MPSISNNAAGVTLVSFCTGNAGLGIHTRKAMTLLFETDRAADNHSRRWDLEWRTAAVWRPPFVQTRGTRDPEGRRAGALTCRSDALRAQLRANPRLGAHAQKITAFTQTHGCVAMSAGNLVHGADLVVTATRSQEPVLKGERLQRAAHVNAVGATITTCREFNDDVMSRCTFIVHSREACLRNPVT